jgi:outer membrane protein assembly factor BamB
MHYLQGWKQEEIAQALGVTQSAISKRLERGVTELRRLLGKAGITVSAVALAALVTANAAEAAPATLTASLGKIGLAGVGSPGKEMALWGGATMLKIGIVTAIVAVVALTAVVVRNGSADSPARQDGRVSPGGMLKLVWSAPGTWRFLHSPAVVGDKVYASLDFGAVKVFDLASGKLLSSVKPPEYGDYATPVIEGDTLYLAGTNSNMTAFVLPDLTVRWSQYVVPKDFGLEPGRASMHPIFTLAAPALGADYLYACLSNGDLYALRKDTGEVVWKRQPGRTLDAMPCLVRSLVYVASTDQGLVAFDPASGDVRWTADVGGVAGFAVAPDNGDTAYTTGAQGDIFAVDTAQGKIRWRKHIGFKFRSGIDLSDDLLCAADEQAVYGVNPKTGDLLWQTAQGGENPSIAGQHVLYNSHDGRLIVLDRTNGTMLDAAFVGEGSSWSCPVVAENRVLDAAGSRLFCFELTTGRANAPGRTLSDLEAQRRAILETLYAAWLAQLAALRAAPYDADVSNAPYDDEYVSQPLRWIQAWSGLDRTRLAQLVEQYKADLAKQPNATPDGKPLIRRALAEQYVALCGAYFKRLQGITEGGMVGYSVIANGDSSLIFRGPSDPTAIDMVPQLTIFEDAFGNMIHRSTFREYAPALAQVSRSVPDRVLVCLDRANDLEPYITDEKGNVALMLQCVARYVVDSQNPDEKATLEKILAKFRKRADQLDERYQYHRSQGEKYDSPAPLYAHLAIGYHALGEEQPARECLDLALGALKTYPELMKDDATRARITFQVLAAQLVIEPDKADERGKAFLAEIFPAPGAPSKIEMGMICDYIYAAPQLLGPAWEEALKRDIPPLRAASPNSKEYWRLHEARPYLRELYARGQILDALAFYGKLAAMKNIDAAAKVQRIRLSLLNDCSLGYALSRMSLDAGAGEQLAAIEAAVNGMVKAQDR